MQSEQDPTSIAKELQTLRAACEKTRRLSRALRRKSSAVDGRLAEQSRQQLNNSRDLLAKTERPARQSM